LRLLKAVLIPTTIKYLLFPDDPVLFKSSDKGEPLSMDSCAALAAANSISKFEIVLSNVLYSMYNSKLAVQDAFIQINYVSRM
jgi:hypothetical protein